MLESKKYVNEKLSLQRHQFEIVIKIMNILENFRYWRLK